MSGLKGKKICLVISSLGFGGAEKSSALLSRLLNEVGSNIHIITVLDHIEYEYKGQLLNLGLLKKKNDSLLGRIQRLFVFKKYLKKHQFDFVIDNRTRGSFIKEFIISKFIYKPKKTIYNVMSFHYERYINKSNFIGKLLYSDAHQIVCVSKEIKNTLYRKYNFKNLSTIPESINITKELFHNRLIKGDYILFFGRLDDKVKNISLLLESYSISNLIKLKIPLVILGDGPDKKKLQKKCEELNISTEVIFKGFISQPNHFVNQALFTILTSRYEGFPRSILESLAQGTPVISVNCKSGPSEMITHKYNGLLVENDNPQGLSEAMNLFLKDKSLYLNCKRNTIQSVQKFSKKNIIKKWQTILN